MAQLKILKILSLCTVTVAVLFCNHVNSEQDDGGFQEPGGDWNPKNDFGLSLPARFPYLSGSLLQEGEEESPPNSGWLSEKEPPIQITTEFPPWLSPSAIPQFKTPEVTTSTDSTTIPNLAKPKWGNKKIGGGGSEKPWRVLVLRPKITKSLTPMPSTGSGSATMPVTPPSTGSLTSPSTTDQSAANLGNSTGMNWRGNLIWGRRPGSGANNATSSTSVSTVTQSSTTRSTTTNFQFTGNRNIGWGWGQNASPGTSPTTDLIVNTTSGALQGFIMQTANARPINAFQSIPFARPPVGSLRFRDPLPNLPWDGVRDAIAVAPQCIQTDLTRQLEIHGQEDCLYLNVYRPANPRVPRKRLPVMVWLHGGGFIFGSGSIFGPAYLLDHEVILVTVNYRLGPFGFLSTGDDSSPGNQGMKDQVLALRWVRDNIRFFGGDPNSVTLFGVSVGGGSAQHHAVSPMSRGLFHRGISQSGSSMSYWSISRNAPEIARRTAELFNCNRTRSAEMVECLRGIDSQQLATAKIRLSEWNVFPLHQFGPVVEHNHTGAYLVDTPQRIYQNGGAMKVPWIFGFTDTELAWFTANIMLEPELVADINNDWERVGPLLLTLTGNSSSTARQIWNFYMGANNLTFETRHQFSNMVSDRIIHEGSLEAMRYHSMSTRQPVYNFRLTYQGNYSLIQLNNQNPQDWGVVHMDDVIYLLNNTDYYRDTLRPDQPEFQMVRMMTGIWVNFATYGRPYINGTNGRLQETWIPMLQSNSLGSAVNFLELDLTPTMIDDPYVERYNFWRRLSIN